MYGVMKRVLLFITTLLFVFKTGYGQSNVYHPFPDTSAKWNQMYWYDYTGSPPCQVTSPNIIFLAGDTIISSLHYKKLLGSGYEYCQLPSDDCCVHYNTYAGAIRQDSVHKKVYYCAVSTTTDRLLYDFNLNIGDTLPTSYNNCCDSNYVSSIDSILIGTTYRKQYHISTGILAGNSTNYVQLIEGIGSTLGLAYQITPGFESGSNLNCFIQNNVTVYTNPQQQGVGCDLSIGIKIINRQLTFNISPNPSSGNISIAGNIKNIDELKVTDMLGQLVYEAKPNTINTTLTLPDTGVYFITLTSGTETSTKKVIVSK